MNVQIRRSEVEGGPGTRKWVQDLFLSRFRSVPLQKMLDAASVPMPSGARLAVTSQACSVQPLAFPGGDLGRLAVVRAVNNLVVMGASPRFLTVSFVLEEGLGIREVERIVSSMAKVAAESTAEVIAGDTRIVSRGAVGEVQVSVTGIGVIDTPMADLTQRPLREGDQVVVNHYLGDHGVAVLSARQGRPVKGIKSDARSLHQLARVATAQSGLKRMTDVSRGGLAAALTKLAEDGGIAIEIDRSAVPVREETIEYCRRLGCDPLHVPAAGVLVAVAAKEDAERIRLEWSRMPGGEAAAIIGEIKPVPKRKVQIRETRGEVHPLALVRGTPFVGVG